jgi:hypothetical protein
MRHIRETGQTHKFFWRKLTERGHSEYLGVYGKTTKMNLKSVSTRLIWIRIRTRGGALVNAVMNVWVP